MTSRLLLRRFPYARHAAVATAAPQTSSLPLRGGNPRELRVVVARGAASARGVAKARKLGASAMWIFGQIVLAGAVTSCDNSVTTQKPRDPRASVRCTWNLD